MKTRSEIIADLKRLRREIEIDFNTAEHWNRCSRARLEEGAEPIDPDPFGEMRRLMNAIDECLDKDTGEGPIPLLNFKRSH